MGCNYHIDKCGYKFKEEVSIQKLKKDNGNRYQKLGWEDLRQVYCYTWL